MQQYLLGLVAELGFVSAHVSCDPGDLFVVMTDDLTETLNSADEECGLAHLEESVAAHATESLPQIYETLMRAVSDFREQRNDRTVLLIRALAGRAEFPA